MNDFTQIMRTTADGHSDIVLKLWDQLRKLFAPVLTQDHQDKILYDAKYAQEECVTD